MKRKTIPTILLLFFLSLFTAFGQEVTVSDARFCKGDDPAFSAPGFDDATWPVLSLEKDWTKQGIANAYGYGWYRIHVIIPSSLKKGAADKVVLDLGPIDDNDETWFNGRFAGKTDGWNKPRRYLVDAKSVNWDKENVIAVRVYNGGEPGGFYEGPARIGKPVLSDFVSMSLTGEKGACKMTLQSAVKSSGTVNMKVINPLTGETENAQMRPVRLSPKQPVTLSWPTEEQRIVSVTYRDDKIDGTLAASYEVPYILTPPAPASPRYNGPLVFGVRPGSPVIFRLAFSGERPMKFAVEGLPAGVKLDAEQGVLSGSVKEKGDYPLVLVATNAHGEVRQDFTLKVGDKIALTPPMGWNSWNCWGLSVSQEKVMSSAAALINRGLADYGYAYINVDDAWEAEERAADGRIVCNEKFPDMKGLGDWLHGNGLKLGIYSSPGDRTCGGYLGSIDHEKQDAETWNEWGVDYLKYDWCGYSKVFNAQNDRSVSSYIRPYLKMQEFLRQQPRDIFYSLCQYGMANVWTWGPFVDANSWRTTGDITDTWQSLYRIGFELQPELYPYAGPGHWNDPDMLVVGKVGWSNNLRDSRLTPDEQYTHITLWSLLAANMLIGCDIAQIDDFTFNLLCNNEVNAVNQDVLGVQAHRDIDEDGVQIWSRPLADGSTAIGIFNLNDQPVPVNIAGALGKLGLTVPATVRDLWRQQDIAPDTYVIPRHGVRFIKYCAPQPNEPDPKYIVQISVGHWKAPTFSAEQIIARLDTVSRLIPIEKVIIGWSLDKDLYKKVGAYLHEKDIHMLLWLPVFAETEGVLDNSPAVDLWGRLPAEYAAGGFRFNCPTDPHNLANVVSLYDKCFSDCGFDGVFLDRVRTQSFVSGVGGVLNCGCPICAAHYAAEGVDLEEVRKAWEQKGDDFLSVSNYDPVTGFEFADPLAADFFRAKGHIVSNSVAAVCDSFHHRGLEVGLDLYAPFMAPFVGQDYDILSRHADFIKPMLYRMTFAPAGMGYEYDLLRKAIPGAKGYPDLKMDVAFLESQLEAMADCPCAKYPGIEINYRADIVPTSPEYVAESLAAVMRYHFDGLDLSWNIMEAPDAHIACLGK